MLLGALLDVGDSKSMEQFVVSSCTIAFFTSMHCCTLYVSMKFTYVYISVSTAAFYIVCVSVAGEGDVL